MQGIYLAGYKRPKSKKEVKLAVEAGNTVIAEATSMFGGEYEGNIAEMPEGTQINFVGPDPFKDRKFYGTITRKGDRITVK